MLSSGPLWPLVVEAAGPEWCGVTVGMGRIRGLTIAAGDGRVVVEGTAGDDRIGAAWDLTVALLHLMDDEVFAGVGAEIRLGTLVVDVPAEVLAGVLAGEDRPWWRERIDVRLG